MFNSLPLKCRSIRPKHKFSISPLNQASTEEIEELKKIPGVQEARYSERNILPRIIELQMESDGFSHEQNFNEG